MHNADGVSVRNTDDAPGKLSSTVATTQVRLRSSKARNEIENDGERLVQTGSVTPIFGSDSFSNFERPLCLLSVVVAEEIVTMIKDDPFYAQPALLIKLPAILAVLSPKKSLDILHKFILRHCCMPTPIPKPSSSKWS
jgi:hypothetical protein